MVQANSAHLECRGVCLPRLDVLLVDPLEDVAGHRRIQEGVEADEDVRLDHVDTVEVLAEDGGEADLPQLLQLVWGDGSGAGDCVLASTPAAPLNNWQRR